MPKSRHSTCRKCGACCEAPSISTHLPGMPNGKPAGVPCIHRGPDMRCMIYDRRPAVCRNYSPTPDLCGDTYDSAMRLIGNLERLTIA
ncbi:MAG TPA: YkgJ family cysteine cluster protein [Spirochaetota bacterium]|nr:YkgJ family cysteine cluster protein [Spirochaetota bacterium]HRZ28260.1 YkgJ family cysteine cluster protein [Spirochaetota bacterium]